MEISILYITSNTDQTVKFSSCKSGLFWQQIICGTVYVYCSADFFYFNCDYIGRRFIWSEHESELFGDVLVITICIVA